MSDLFYDIVVFFGRHPFWVSERAVVLNPCATDRPGPFILACTHTSPYDVPLLMRHSYRRIDFVSIVEVFSKPLAGWFYGSMNAFPIDRSKPDSPKVRVILDRLAKGRVIGMFPEGRFRRGEASVVYSKQIRPGIGRLAKLANVPIVPVVVVNSVAYSRWQSWLPFRRTRYAIGFGEPIEPNAEAEEIERTLIEAMVELHTRLERQTGISIA